MVDTQLNIEDQIVKDALISLTDPEIPVLSIMDMGIVRSLEQKDKTLHIQITPTYSGCPAMDTIATDIKLKLESLGYSATIELVLSPAWTTDWITANGREKLEAYGIAAPLTEDADKSALFDQKRIVPCPQCQSTNTSMISQFGSTACKALFKCNDCLEPFDYFKCLK